MILTMIGWWAILTVLGLATLPATLFLFRRLPDQGYTLARPLGLLLAAYVLWLGASLRVVPNNWAGIGAALFILLVISMLALNKLGGPQALRLHFSSQKKLILWVEVLFFLTFMAWSLVRAHTVFFRINPSGGEKFMEMAFLNGILNSQFFPPADPWLSDYGISYYYFGYVMMALLTRLSGLLPEIAFDLYDATLFALTFTGAFGVAYNLIASHQTRAPRFFAAALGGLAGACLTTVSGNLLGLMEALHARGWLPPVFTRWLAVPGLDSAEITGAFYPAGELWWWRSSRILNDLDLFGQPIGANPITEFPFFSFLLGDNHPHVLALPFVLLAISIGFNWHLAALRDDQLTPIEWIASALALGSLVFLNTWDYPIYLALALSAWLTGTMARRGRLAKPDLFQFARISLRAILVTALAYALFIISFSSQAGGILPYIFPPTRLPQYLIIFGPFIFILTCFLLTTRSDRLDKKVFAAWWWRLSALLILTHLLLIVVVSLVLALDQARGGSLLNEAQAWLGGLPWWQALLRVLASRLTNPWLFLLLTSLLALGASSLWLSLARPTQPPSPDEFTPPPPEPGLTFTRLLILLGLALTFAVEFLYLRDNFGVRMNTVFKFYFQGWVILALASAYALWWMIDRARNTLPKLSQIGFTLGVMLLGCGTLVYPVLATLTRVNRFTAPPILDGSALLRAASPDDFAAIDWIRANTPPDAVILEAPGQSYNFEGRISAFTGRPTLLGWSYHEAQWRGSYTEQARREADIATIFKDLTAPEASALLRQWQVQYIVIGASERDYLANLCSQAENRCAADRILSQLSSSFTRVFESGSVEIYSVPHTIP